MLITTAQSIPKYGIAITLFLLALLVTFELLPDARKERAKGFFIGAIAVFLAAFIFIIMHRLEGIL